MGLFSLFLLSMRPAYNNPFNQAANPSARRQRAINNKATHLLIFVFGGGGRTTTGGSEAFQHFTVRPKKQPSTWHENDFICV